MFSTSLRGAQRRGNLPLVWVQKNETRHSREAPHTNHIINNTKTNNRVQRYGNFADLQ